MHRGMLFPMRSVLEDTSTKTCLSLRGSQGIDLDVLAGLNSLFYEGLNGPIHEVPKARIEIKAHILAKLLPEVASDEGGFAENIWVEREVVPSKHIVREP